jgi:hypothetical protein
VLRTPSRLPRGLVESSRASPPRRPREDGLTHPADTSRSNLAAACCLAFQTRVCGDGRAYASLTRLPYLHHLLQLLASLQALQLGAVRQFARLQPPLDTHQPWTGASKPDPFERISGTQPHAHASRSTRGWPTCERSGASRPLEGCARATHSNGRREHGATPCEALRSPHGRTERAREGISNGMMWDWCSVLRTIWVACGCVLTTVCVYKSSPSQPALNPTLPPRPHRQLPHAAALNMYVQPAEGPSDSQ